MKRSIAKFANLSCLAAAAVLTACGGGGGDSTASVPLAGPTSLKISGTAAVGAALANATVHVTCSAGAATATSDANGVFTVSIDSGALPCVLTAVSTDGATELHSVASGTGNAETTANITPLSELLVAKLAGVDPKAFVSGFGSTTVISDANVIAAQTALLQTLAAAGIDTTNVINIVGGAITAGSGNGYDGVLDKLKTAMDTAGVTLADLTTTVSATNAVGGDSGTSVIKTVLAPAAPDCAGLKSGTLRVLDFSTGENGLVTVDAAKLTATSEGVTYTLTKNAACDYTLNDDLTTRVLVAPSGLAVLLSGTGATGVAGIAMPEQKLDVATMAGSYDRVQYGPFDTEAGDFGTTIFAADGQNGLSVNCPLGVGNCVEDALPKGKLVANAAGGFDYMENGASQARVFGFHNPSGRNFMIGQAADGTVIMLAGKDNLALPAVGRVSSFWQFTVTNTGLSTVSSDTNTTTAVDATTGVVTRQFASDGHFDTIAFNAPFAGTRYKATNGCATATGGALSCNGAVQMAFGGLVMVVSSVPTKHFISVAIDKP